MVGCLTISLGLGLASDTCCSPRAHSYHINELLALPTWPPDIARQNSVYGIVKAVSFSLTHFFFSPSSSFLLPVTLVIFKFFVHAVYTTAEKRKLLVAMYNYVANENSPGGFNELSLHKG